jgi:hypothetical protein
VTGSKGFAVVPNTNGRNICTAFTRFWEFGGAIFSHEDAISEKVRAKLRFWKYRSKLRGLQDLRRRKVVPSFMYNSERPLSMVSASE